MLVAIDPGETTGYCVVDETKADILSVGTGSSFAAVYETLLKLESKYARLTLDKIIVEKFSRARELNSAQLFTVKVIGIVEMFAERHPDIELIFQLPFERKPHHEAARAEFAKLSKRISGLRGYQKAHITDAIAHWFAYRAKVRSSAYLKELAKRSIRGETNRNDPSNRTTSV